jgi:hypothetical protein
MRKPAKKDRSAIVAEVAPVREADDSQIPMLDARGDGFELLRGVDIGRALWRPNDAADLESLARRDVVIVAAYSDDDITSYRPLMQRCMTIVLAVGLGPQYGSRALTLGAVAYIEASLGRGDISGAFSDAFARISTRRLRDLAA